MYIDYKTTKIHFTSQGEGQTLVLLHGFLEDSSMWEPFISDLKMRAHVVCVDLLGHGQSGCLSGTHSMESMAMAVLAVLQSLNIDTAKIVGHSMGGYVALALAEIQPQLITDLVLLNSTFSADSPERQDLRTKAITQASYHFEKLIRVTFLNLFAEESRTIHKDEIDRALTKALETPLEGFIAAMEGMKRRPDRLEIFSTIKGRKIIIVGRKDSLINFNDLRKNSQDRQIEILEFSEGHMSHIENKSELSYFFKRFIENLPS